MKEFLSAKDSINNIQIIVKIDVKMKLNQIILPWKNPLFKINILVLYVLNLIHFLKIPTLVREILVCLLVEALAKIIPNF